MRVKELIRRLKDQGKNGEVFLYEASGEITFPLKHVYTKITVTTINSPKVMLVGRVVK